MERYIDADSTIKAIRNRFNIYFEIPCDSDDRRVQEIIGEVKKIIQEQPTADVVPKSEVEQLQIELEAMRTAASSYKMHYENLARDIFKDVRELLFSSFTAVMPCNSRLVNLNELAEIEKKYMEEKR